MHLAVGMWNMREYKFVEGKKVTSWALLCFISSGGQGSHGGYSRQCWFVFLLR